MESSRFMVRYPLYRYLTVLPVSTFSPWKHHLSASDLEANLRPEPVIDAPNSGICQDFNQGGGASPASETGVWAAGGGSLGSAGHSFRIMAGLIQNGGDAAR